MKKVLKVSEAIENLEIVKKSCDEAISGDWDKSDSGFEDMKAVIDSVIKFLNERQVII